MPPAATAAFADCPRCGGWARLLSERHRAKCRGCNWSGIVPAAARMG